MAQSHKDSSRIELWEQVYNYYGCSVICSVRNYLEPLVGEKYTDILIQAERNNV